MRTLKMIVASFVLVLMVGMPVTMADTPTDCGDALSQQLYFEIGKIRSGTLKPADAMASFNAAVDACPYNPFALHYAGLVGTHLARAKNQQTPGAQDVFDMWSEAFARSQVFWNLEDQDHSFVIGHYTGVELSYQEKRDLRKDLLIGLMEFHTKLNKPHPYVAETAPMQACPTSGFTDVMALSEWHIANPTGGEAVMTFVERVANACEFNADTRFMYVAVNRIRLRHAETVATSEPESARAILTRARAFRERVLKPGETVNYNWPSQQAEKLAKIEHLLPNKATIPTDQESPLVSAGAVPVKDWFNGQVEERQVTEAIGWTLNAYWVAEDPQGLVRGIGKMYKATTEAADPESAKTVLYNAISQYDRNRFRSLETAGKDVPGFMYEWLNKPTD